MKIGAVAGSRTRTCALAQRHSPLKSQPRKLKGRDLFQSRPMPFQQRTNTSCYLAIPTHGFTVVLSVFWGTPPAKPLKCKSVSIVSARDFASDGQRPPVESLGFPAPQFVWCYRTSSRRHFPSTHSALPCVIKFHFCFGSAWVNKKPCFHSGKQGLEIRCLVRLPAHLHSIQTGFGLLPAI